MNKQLKRTRGVDGEMAPLARFRIPQKNTHASTSSTRESSGMNLLLNKYEIQEILEFMASSLSVASIEIGTIAPHALPKFQPGNDNARGAFI